MYKYYSYFDLFILLEFENNKMFIDILYKYVCEIHVICRGLDHSMLY